MQSGLTRWCGLGLTAACAIATLGPARPAHAQGVYFSTKQVLQAFFHDSRHVGFVRVQTAAASGELHELLGYVPSKPSYVVYVGRTGEHVDGYAVIDEQRGEHLPITFAVLVSPDGAVRRSAVMVYREAYGSEIRDPRFRHQFVGKRVGDPLRLGDDVAVVSGATISSRSMTTVIKRALALVQVVRDRQAAADTVARSDPEPASGGKGGVP